MVTDAIALISALTAFLVALTPLICLLLRRGEANDRQREISSDASADNRSPSGVRRVTIGVVIVTSLLAFNALGLFLVPRILADTDAPPPAGSGHPSPSGLASATPSPATPTRPACEHELTILSPADRTAFSGTSGVLLSGNACGLNGRTVWLYDLDTGDGYYYPADDGPIVTDDGNWQFADTPIGDDGDNHKSFIMTLILADQACSEILRGLTPIDGDRKFRTVPAACAVAGKVEVLISNP